ncbi:MAG: hypothetical protein EWM47_11755 [Anaerolineaceae bacterium]|nr:MAG: hypothetical protein EWM47_11755 [Anaerolineaceae bacterium]
MKKFIALLIVLLMTISMIGCARNTEDDEASSRKQSENISKELEIEDNDDKQDNNADDNNEDSTVSIVLTNSNTDLINKDKIPDEYPMDLVPFPAGAEIYSGIESDLWGMLNFYVVAITEDSFDDVQLFYKEALDNLGLEELIGDYGYVVQGEYNKMSIIVTVKDETKDPTFDIRFKTSIYIDVTLLDDEILKQLQEADSNNNQQDEYYVDYEMEESYPEEDLYEQSNSADNDIFTGGNADAINSTNTNLTGEPIPDGFNIDLVPIPEGSFITGTSSYESGGNKIYAISASSKYEANDLVAFFMKGFKDAEDLCGNQIGYSYLIENTLNDAYISIFVYPDEYDSYKSGFEISMDLSD